MIPLGCDGLEVQRNRDTLSSFGRTLSCFSWLTAALLHAYCLFLLVSSGSAVRFSSAHQFTWFTLQSLVRLRVGERLDLGDVRWPSHRNDQLYRSLHATPLIHSVNKSNTANKALTIQSSERCTSELVFASAEIRRLLSYSAQTLDAAELSLLSIQKSI